MSDLERLKSLIDEDNYPYFDDIYLQSRIDGLTDAPLESLARELCLVKTGIEEMKLGDVVIPSPKSHFLSLARSYRSNKTGTVIRVDERL
jgi:hypothetical protein